MKFNITVEHTQQTKEYKKLKLNIEIRNERICNERLSKIY